MKRLALALLCSLALSAGAQAQSCGSGANPSGGNVTPLVVSGTGTTGAVTATLPAVVGKFTYLCGWMITSAGATAGSVGTATITGLASGTWSNAYIDPSTGQGFLGASLAPYCLTTATTNVAIVLTAPGGGTGTVAKTATAWGCNQ